jgi:hypothetical protein
MENREERIKRRAYELWENAGKPDDREDEFWMKAEREIAGADEPGETPIGRASPPPTA